MTLFAAGLIVRNSGAGELIYDSETGEIIDDDRSEAGVALGALAHWYFLLRARFRRKPAAKTGPASARHRTIGNSAAPERIGIVGHIGAAVRRMLAPPDDGLGQLDTSGRREPGFAGEGPLVEPEIDVDESDDSDYLRAPEMAPAYGEKIYDADWRMRIQPRTGSQGPSRKARLRASPASSGQ